MPIEIDISKVSRQTSVMYRFPDEKLKAIKAAIDQALDRQKANPIAAFDADGTLWATDIGESFFKYQYKNQLLEGLPEDPWSHYKKLYEQDRDSCYLWLAQINKGLNIDQVRKWARESVRTHPDMGVFSGQKEVISHLKRRGVKVYIVTASVKWAVEPAAEIFGIPPENVIGIVTKIENGIVSTEVGGPITHSEGKVKGLLEATKGQHAFFTAGNTKSDLALLESATHLRLVISSANQGDEQFETEQYMQTLAKERNWLQHSF